VSPAVFLAARELRRRGGRAALAAAVVAGAVALSVGLELLGRARERAVEAQLDAAGPALRVLPAGVTAVDAAALRLVDAALPRDVESRARVVLAGGLRRMEARTILRDEATGATVVAWRAPPRGLPKLAERRAVRGAFAAPAAEVRVLGHALPVVALAPSTAGAEDLAFHVLAADIGAPAAGELRLFLEPGTSPREAEGALRAALSDVAVIRSDRGEVADGGLQASLASHRRAVQLVTAVVAALALLIATHLDVAERRRELALLAAIGLRRGSLAALVALRAVASAAAGAALGLAVAVALAAAQPDFVASALPTIAVTVLLLAVGLAAAAAAPVAMGAAASDPVAELQES
jgi:hypothetical protein